MLLQEMGCPALLLGCLGYGTGMERVWFAWTLKFRKESALCTLAAVLALSIPLCENGTGLGRYNMARNIAAGLDNLSMAQGMERHLFHSMERRLVPYLPEGYGTSLVP